MSATNSQALVGQSHSAAPFGLVAALAGVLAIGAIGIALGQGIKAAPAAVVPADVQAALIAQRMGEKATLFAARDGRMIQHQGELQDRAAAVAVSNPFLIQHFGELQDRAAAAGSPMSILDVQRDAAIRFGGAAAATTPFAGKATDDLSIPVVVAPQYAGKVRDAVSAAPRSTAGYATGGKGVNDR